MTLRLVSVAGAGAGTDAGADPEWLEVLRLGRGVWRMSDTRLDVGNRVLGYLERVRRSRYEILWLSDPIGWAYVSTFSEGVAAFVDAAHFAGSVEAVRDPAVSTSGVSLLPRPRRGTSAGRTSRSQI